MLSALYVVDLFFFSSRRRHTRSDRDWSSDVCSSDLNSRIAKPVRVGGAVADGRPAHPRAKKPVPQLGTPSVVPSNPNSRLGRTASPEIGRASCRERV